MNDKLKFYHDVALNHVREKGKSLYKISYKVLKEEYGYYTLLGIYPYPKLIQLNDFIGRIHHCVTVVGNGIFDSNFPFELPHRKYN